jgi:hypothetical protein
MLGRHKLRHRDGGAIPLRRIDASVFVCRHLPLDAVFCDGIGGTNRLSPLPPAIGEMPAQPAGAGFAARV